jgi:hypothetical protein
MRKRSEPHTFEQRLEQQKLRLEADAASLPRGERRDAIVKRIEQLELAAKMNIWLTRAGEDSVAGVGSRLPQRSGAR